jgi:hypothetical protein
MPDEYMDDRILCNQEFDNDISREGKKKFCETISFVEEPMNRKEG